MAKKSKIAAQRKREILDMAHRGELPVITKSSW